MWEDRQIVPKDWVLLTTKPYNPDLNPAYGYLWWVNGYSDNWRPMEGQINTGLPKVGYFFGYGVPPDSYAAEGAFGQMIAVIPELDLVMVRNGGSEDYTERDIFPLLCDTVVEAP